MVGKPNVFDAARDAAAVLKKLDADERARALRFVADALGLAVPKDTAPGADDDDSGDGDGEHKGRTDAGTNPSPKKFIDEKRPKSKVEEIACLAYYLTRTRNMPKWKPDAIDKLNTEAGGHSFEVVSRELSNAKSSARVVTNAGTGQWRITRDGEKLVEALPDREKVLAVRKGTRRPTKRSTKKSTKKRS